MLACLRACLLACLRACLGWVGLGWERCWRGGGGRGTHAPCQVFSDRTVFTCRFCFFPLVLPFRSRVFGLPGETFPFFFRRNAYIYNCWYLLCTLRYLQTMLHFLFFVSRFFYIRLWPADDTLTPLAVRREINRERERGGGEDETFCGGLCLCVFVFFCIFFLSRTS